MPEAALMRRLGWGLKMKEVFGLILSEAEVGVGFNDMLWELYELVAVCRGEEGQYCKSLRV